MNRSDMWTADQDAALFRLFLVEGHSASQTAKLLPGPKRSRNAIIGRAHRLRFNRGKASAPTIKTPYPKRAAPKHVRRKAQPVVPGWKDSGSLPPTPTSTRGADIESPNAGPWIARTARQCAFPVGDETGAGQWSCCNATESGQSYCPGHAGIMFNPATKLNTHGVDLKATRPKAEPREQFFSDWAAA